MTVGAVLGILTVTGRQENVARSRRFVADILGRHPREDTAVLLTSELVANAIVHGPPGGLVTIVALRVPGGVRIEVSDTGVTGDPRVRGWDMSDPDIENGRGLFLVDALADRWDHHRDAAGRTVWFELGDPVPQADAGKSSMVS